MFYWLAVIVSFVFLQFAQAASPNLSECYQGSWQGDPASLVENVSTIHGDYTEIEVDLTVATPDPLVISRFYSSRDSSETAFLGGWRFNPHCFLQLEDDSCAYVGNPDGSILTYIRSKEPTTATQRVLFTIDVDTYSSSLANNSAGEILPWTNVKTNQLYFDPHKNSFDLLLYCQGKRFYVKHPVLNLYVMTHEILPSGNKIFYEFDKEGRLGLIKQMNSAENKVLAWIKIHYGTEIKLESSDGKTVLYRFEKAQERLLTEVIRSHKPCLKYEYQIVNGHQLLSKTILPEGRFTQIEYEQGKVRSLVTPVATTQFVYGDGWTEVTASGNRKSVHRFNANKQLVAVEHYLDNALYRVYRKSWLSGNLLSTSIEDAQGNTFYYKYWGYDQGNVVIEREYGDIAGNGLVPLSIKPEGEVANTEAHVTRYSYFSGKDTYGVFQRDEKGCGVKYWYKKGTNLLLKKMVLTHGSPDSEYEGFSSGIEERHFYTYNEDGALMRLVVDDAKGAHVEDCTEMTKRLITEISPKKSGPNVGAVEVIEQKYTTANGKRKCLLKKIENQFDLEGNIISQAVYDAKGEHRYSTSKRYESGLLVFETDPLGHEIHYSYDANHNLIQVARSNTDLVTQYRYDLNNRLVSTSENDGQGHCFESSITYDLAGYKSAEVDRFGNQTLIINDSLGRPTQVAHLSQGREYQYEHDLFDHLTAVVDPAGRRLTRAFNIRGRPTLMHYADGTHESFRYDSAGNLHHYYDREGVLQIFTYDQKGRSCRVAYYEGGADGLGDLFKQQTSHYDAFHKTFEIDARGYKTSYTYDGAGRLSCSEKGDQKIEFFYDALGRVESVKKWKSTNTFTLEVKEYDLLDRIMKERVEDSKGKILVRKGFVYNEAGQLAQVIGYPHNQESVLFSYEYDCFLRLVRIIDAIGRETQISYDDTYVNDEGKRELKRVVVDPSGGRTEEIFDEEDRLLGTTQIDVSGQLLNSIANTYDPLSHQLLEQVAQPASYHTQWSFNQKDQLEYLSLSNRDPVRFAYHSSGQLAARYNPGSEEPITYIYDRKGVLKTLSYKEGDRNVTFDLSYDSHNNLISMTKGPNLFIHCTFNPQDQLLSETTKDEFGSYRVKATYDGEGNIETLELPDGSIVGYAYQGPFVKEIARYSKDDEDLYIHRIDSRDQMGNILKETLPGRLGKRFQSWDKCARRVELITDFSHDQIPEGGYDALDQITTITRTGQQFYYGYNSASQLICEKNSSEYSYAYDAIGNRLQKNGAAYTINNRGELQEAEGIHYTYDASGNLATKTIDAQTWIYRSNPLNQLTSIQDPDGTITTFTYDLGHRRLSKRIESKGIKPKIFRFFYLGDTEIGAVNEKGQVIQLKVPRNPNHPEESCIAIESRNQWYVPLYDFQGNIVNLLDPLERISVESYRYSAYGEEEIFDKKGKPLSASSVGNPWRYRGKRVEKKFGLIYFGHRYYDPKIGRWTSLDPAGTLDGPNLYAFVHNNPLKYVDYFGLASAIAENCGCTQHNHPGWHNAPPGCVCICGCVKVNMDPTSYRRTIGSALGGIGHGVVDFMVSSLQELQTMAVYISSSDLEMQLHERIHMIEAVEESQAAKRVDLGRALMDMMSIDESDAVYQSCRSTTTMGLAVGSLIAGGYGAVKGVMAFNRLVKMPVQVASLARKSASLGRGAENINAGISLTTKLRQLETIQQTAAKIRVLPGGRIRYYKAERMATYPGSTRGSAYVTEYNSTTGQVRGWNECYDQLGNVNRVHPKDINGQSFVSPHYPLIAQEITP